MRFAGLRLLAILGLFPLVFGIGSLVDGDFLIGALATIVGIVIGVVPMILLIQRVRAHDGPYAGPKPDPVILADEGLTRASRLNGRILQIIGVAPLLGAVALIFLGWYIPHQDDDGSAGARVALLLLMTLFAIVPGTLAFGYFRSGLLTAAGDLSGAEAAVVYNRIVWILGALLTAGALADDRPGPWGLVATVTGVLTVAAFASNGALKSLYRRVVQARSGTTAGSTGGATPPMAQFVVDEVWDVPDRGGLLVEGRLLAGQISAGATLRDAATGTPVSVLGVDFETPRSRELNRTTLIIERTEPTPIAVGRVLTT